VESSVLTSAHSLSRRVRPTQINAIPGTEHVFEADTVIFAPRAVAGTGAIPDLRISKTKNDHRRPPRNGHKRPQRFAGGEAVSPMTIGELWLAVSVQPHP
jgi:hypothetical protein